MDASGADACFQVAVFPLPGVVLFPGALVPLHVFEPRYRALVRHCLEEDSPLAVWQVARGARATPFGPALVPVATIGRIVQHAARPDGRCDVVVRGEHRVRLVAEGPSDHPFRVVQVERHPMDVVTRAQLAPQLVTLRALVHSLARPCPQASSLLQGVLALNQDPAALSDALCSVNDEDGPTRQRLLEMSSVPDRIARVIDTLTTLALVASNATDRDAEPS